MRLQISHYSNLGSPRGGAKFAFRQILLAVFLLFVDFCTGPSRLRMGKNCLSECSELIAQLNSVMN